MNVEERAKKVRLLVMDVDGVLTDGGLFYGAEGELFKRFDVKDGHGLVICRHMGLSTAILTARNSRIVELRGGELGIKHILQARRDKAAGLRELLEQTGLSPEELCYIGDDINDLPVLMQVGLSACPADARPEVLPRVHYVCKARGGHGAVRELCELLLKAQGLWDKAMAMHAGLSSEGP